MAKKHCPYRYFVQVDRGNICSGPSKPFFIYLPNRQLLRTPERMLLIAKRFGEIFRPVSSSLLPPLLLHYNACIPISIASIMNKRKKNMCSMASLYWQCVQICENNIDRLGFKSAHYGKDVIRETRAHATEGQ